MAWWRTVPGAALDAQVFQAPLLMPVRSASSAVVIAPPAAPTAQLCAVGAGLGVGPCLGDGGIARMGDAGR
ncbi:hypothetical protein KBY85_15545, partial [Cyanobium sp. BA5m-10]|uniref:hypothetical protein n=1 Tax=Cyanobium sp. BA5m-10 TaxID=2823705 RepID=UPI0020CB8BD5